MKKIFIYYSLSGNGDKVSDYLKKKCDIRKIKLVKDLPKNRILQIIIGGYKATFNYIEKLKDFDSNIDKYDEVIIGSPIWNDRLSSPIKSALDKLNLKNKNITFILYSASGNANKASDYINSNYDAKIIVLKEPIKNPNELNKLKEI